MSDEEIKTVKPVVVNATPPVVPPAPPAPTAVTLTPEQVASVLGSDYLAVHNFGKTVMNQQKTLMINSLKATGRCPFSDTHLAGLQPAELEALCLLAGAAPVVNAGITPTGGSAQFVPGFQPGQWSNQFNAPMGGPNYMLNNGGTPHFNNGGTGGRQEKDEDGLDEPVINYKDAGKVPA